MLLYAAPLRAATPDATPAPPAAINTPATTPRLADRVAALNDPDYATREAASDALLLDDALDLNALAVAAGDDLPPETRERLLYIALHHTVRQLREDNFPADGPGSIGILQAVQADRLPPDRGGRGGRGGMGRTDRKGRAGVPARPTPWSPACCRAFPPAGACGRKTGSPSSTASRSPAPPPPPPSRPC